MAKKKAYVCAKCGAVYRPTYKEEWGIKYGHALGREPVCENLIPDYTKAITFRPEHPEKAMHPLQVCRGEVMLQDVDETQKENVTALSDPDGSERARRSILDQRKKSKAMDLHHRILEESKAKKNDGW